MFLLLLLLLLAPFPRSRLLRACDVSELGLAKELEFRRRGSSVRCRLTGHLRLLVVQSKRLYLVRILELLRVFLWRRREDPDAIYIRRRCFVDSDRLLLLLVQELNCIVRSKAFQDVSGDALLNPGY